MKPRANALPLWYRRSLRERKGHVHPLKLASAFILAVICFSAVGRVMADPSSAWTSLKEESLGIQIEHPPEWRVKRSSDQVVLSNVDQFSEESDETLANESTFVIARHVGKNPQKLPIDKWFNQKHFEKNASTPPQRQTTVTISGYPAIRIEYSGIGRWAAYFIAINKDVLEISYPVSQPKFASIYTKMLESLRFIK